MTCVRNRDELWVRDEAREGGWGTEQGRHRNSLLAFLIEKFSEQVVPYCRHLSTEQTQTGATLVATKRRTEGAFCKISFTEQIIQA